jgi:hypothetical protein
MNAGIKANISVKQLKRMMPNLETNLMKIGHSEVAKAIASMPKNVAYSLCNISRVAGLTEIEIGLLVGELNECNDGGKIKKGILPKVRFKGGSRKSKQKARR